MELTIIKLLFNYNIYIKYYSYLDLEFIKSNSKYIEKLLYCIEKFHEKFPNKNIQSSDELEVFFYSLYPATPEKERSLMNPLFSKLQATTVSDEVADQYFKEQKKKQAAARMALLALQVSEGGKEWADLEDFYCKVFSQAEKNQEQEESDFVLDNPEEGRPAVGIRWPLQSLNKMMGSLRKGNFGFIFARPETGKTTFLAHVGTNSIKQIEGDVLWFNNEQPGIEVLHRCIESYFGITSKEFYSKKKHYSSLYYEKTNHALKIIDDATISKRRIEELCNKYNPKLIIFDQIDKIKGFNSDRKDLEFGQIYQWGRELSKEFAPVIGVCQAGASGEGKKWLIMDDVDSAKTSKQAEADWILGIGKSHQEGMENIRHFHLCKNKLIGDDDTEPNMRHGKCDVLIRADIARYEDIESKK